jgi:hypothetical protein
LNTYVENMYEMRSTIAFLPGELRDIHNHLLSHNNLKYLMLWVIIIVGVKLFLRIDEALDLKYEPAYFVVKDCNIESLLVKMKGKCDDKWLHALCDDKDCTKLSAAHAILLWIPCRHQRGLLVS